ncbi:MAG: ribosome silencing factor [Rhodoferax sp.]|nr:ribosome silencing factor [Rhodoferax sp.]
MTTTTVAKKDIQKLQRAIVDGLEDVKAQDIQVFDTEHLSALFERVIIASGTSNRQTKALAGSVRDAVRDAGFPKPRVEGEANGEWIIVDCGAAVVHVMQPNFRQYYNLEELWGEKPVRLKFGSAKPAVAEEAEPVKPAKASKAVAPVEGNLRRSNAAKKGVAEAFPSKAQVKKTMAAQSAAAKAPAKKAAAKKLPAKTSTEKSVITKVTINAPAKVPAKVPAKKASAAASTKVAPAKKVAAKKAPARKPADRKA